MIDNIQFEPMSYLRHTCRVVVAQPKPAVVGFIRATPTGGYIARTVGNAVEAAVIRRFPTRDGAARWLLSSGHRRAAA